MSEIYDELPLFSDLKDYPDFSAEDALMKKGYRFIAGVDEVGRGPLAGPVVTAAVILNREDIPKGLNDSKKLTAKRRQILYEEILEKAKAIAVSSISAQEIDATNIRLAALNAMRQSVASLALPADYVLVDGRDIPLYLPCPALALIKGDGRSLSIAAASIVAKICRDKMMERLDKDYKNYGFAKHAGYGTKMHRQALADYGPILGIHRYSFAPLKGCVKSEIP